MPGATFEPFDVVVVPFPFTDLPIAKRRPAVIVSTRAFNRGHGQIVLAMIASAKGSDWPSDVPLRDWRGAGLAVSCRVRLKVFTLDQGLVIRRIGALAAQDLAAVQRALAANLAAG